MTKRLSISVDDWVYDQFLADSSNISAKIQECVVRVAHEDKLKEQQRHYENLLNTTKKQIKVSELEHKSFKYILRKAVTYEWLKYNNAYKEVVCSIQKEEILEVKPCITISNSKELTTLNDVSPTMN